MELWQIVVFGLASLAMSVLSGIAGGGNGFVMTPLMIFLGLSPAQAVSTGKISGLSITLGVLGGMRSQHGLVNRWRVGAVMALSFGVGLVVPFVIKSLEHDTYRIILGVILLLMIPLLLIRKVGIKPHHPRLWQKWAGGVFLTIALFLQGAFSSGLGSLVNMVLMGFLGMTATEANLTKRFSQLVLNITVFLGVVTSGLIVWELVPVMVLTTFVGGYIGGHLAVKRGNQFIMDIMVVLVALSALALIFGFGF